MYPITDRGKRHSTITFRKRSPSQHSLTLRGLVTIDPDLALSTDLQEAWNNFYSDATARLDQNYPLRTITITSKDPPFITPEIKRMLRLKNRFMRKGKIEKAEALSLRIAKAITKKNTSFLKHANPREGAESLWKQVNQITKKTNHDDLPSSLSADDLNNYFANASNDPNYSAPLLKSTAPQSRSTLPKV